LCHGHESLIKRMRTAPAQYAFQERQRPWIGLTENVEDLDVTLSAPSVTLSAPSPNDRPRYASYL